MLQAIHGDASRSLRAAADWDPGAHKLTCPDDQRSIGISARGQGGLCTDATQGDPGGVGVLGDRVDRRRPGLVRTR
ncbi:hypothetical protein [Nocardia sp. NPDC050793]|uniref:hypothetical protein n=1 Tax=Nocardia sp. NPDC050793 TaxID=3155159 RepID=UPI0033C44648